VTSGPVVEKAGDLAGLLTNLEQGDILFIESTRLAGKKSLMLTGHLGEVMKESAQAALSYVRSRADRLGIAADGLLLWTETDLGAVQAQLDDVKPQALVVDSIQTVFLPDLENHELMFSLEKHFEDGPLIPAMVEDAYRYFARLAREHQKPVQVRLFGRYPTYSFYRFDDRAIMAMYSNSVAKKELPAFEVTVEGFLGSFLAADIEDLRRECRVRSPDDLEAVITDAGGHA